jgi:hypothetical protein
MDVEVRLRELCPCWRKRGNMAQQSDTSGPAAALQLDALAIFSAPGVEVVFQWWLESNRRWTERNGPKALSGDPGMTVGNIRPSRG